MSLGSFLKKAFRPNAANVAGILLDPAGKTVRDITGTPNTTRGFFDPSGMILPAPQGGGGNGAVNPLLSAPQGGALPPISTGPMGFYSQLAWQLGGSPAFRQQTQPGALTGYYSPPPRFSYSQTPDIRLPSQASLLGRSY